jgi:photosystem II stability/assembly factor-like uncharacterized protein
MNTDKCKCLVFPSVFIGAPSVAEYFSPWRSWRHWRFNFCCIAQTRHDNWRISNWRITLDKQNLLVGTTKGLFTYSANAAREKWSLADPILPGWEISSVGVIPGDKSPRLLVGTTHYAYGATIRASDDLGQTWRQIEKGPAYTAESGFKLNRIWQIEPDAHDKNTVYAGVDEAGLFVSRDRGETWNEIDSLTQLPSRPKWQPGGGGLCLHTIIPDYTNPRRIWLGISAVGVFRTTDGGKTWAPANAGLPGVATGSDDADAVHCIHKIVQHPRQADKLFMQYHGGVLKSVDGGSQWTTIEHGLPGNFGFPMVATNTGTLCIAPLASQEMRTFGDGALEIYRSTNEGESWTASTKGLPQSYSHVAILRDAMTVDEEKSPGVYFGTTMGHVFASNDDGASWAQLPGDLPRVLSVRTCPLA